jgi:hypothetical protein
MKLPPPNPATLYSKAVAKKSAARAITGGQPPR